MHGIFVVFHVIICVLLIAIVLLQTGRGAEVGAAFGGASRTLFGATGATTAIGKITAVVAILFMINCLILTYYSGRPMVKSIMDKPAPEVSIPAVPEAKPVPMPSKDNGQTGLDMEQKNVNEPVSTNSTGVPSSGDVEK